MTDRLDRFETQLTSAVARRARRGRQRRTACVATAAAVTVTAGAGAATGTLDPLALFDSTPSLQTDGPMRPSDTTRLQLESSDDAAERWSVAAYRANLSVCGAIATPAQPRPSIICQGSLPIAQTIARSSVPATLSTLRLGETDGDRQTVLVYGFAAGQDTDLTVTADGETVGTLKSTDQVLSVPVDRDNPDLTPEGRQQAQALPNSLDLRLIATEVSVTTQQATTLSLVAGDRSSAAIAPPSN